MVAGFAPTSRAVYQLGDAGIAADTLQGFLAHSIQRDDTLHLYMLDESSNPPFQEWTEVLGSECLTARQA